MALGSNATATSTPDSGSNLLSSSPLIIGFLAITLFLATILAVIGWRRMVFSRMRAADAAAASAAAAAGSDGPVVLNHLDMVVNLPKLWELWTESDPKGAGIIAPSWKDIMVTVPVLSLLAVR